MSFLLRLAACTIILAAVAAMRPVAANAALKASERIAPEVATERTTAISLKLGQTVLISLEANPSTGFRWSLVPRDESASVAVAVDGAAYQAPTESNRVGSAGRQVFVARAIKRGTSTLEFAYRRSFDSAQEPGQVYTLTVTVK